MSPTHLHSLAGFEVVFTGRPPTGYLVADLEKHAMNARARRISDDLNKSTDVLVLCGNSGHWKYGSHGTKEKKVADLQRRGSRVVMIDLHGFLELTQGRPAQIIRPIAAR